MYPWEELVASKDLTQEWIDFLNKINLSKDENGNWMVEYLGEIRLVDFVIISFLPGIAVQLSKNGEPFHSVFIAIPGMDYRKVTRGDKFHKSIWDQGEE